MDRRWNEGSLEDVYGLMIPRRERENVSAIGIETNKSSPRAPSGELLDVMFELPSRTDVTKCVITKETISKGLKPTLVTSAEGMVDELDELAEESA